MTAAAQRDISYENLVVRFQQKNGFNKVGHKGYAVLTTLWEIAARNGWDEKLACHNKDVIIAAGLRDAAELYHIRLKLMKHGYLKNYISPGNGTGDPGIYFLDFGL